MLLHCEREAAARDGPAEDGAWLCSGTLASLAELNELGLALLAEQAESRGGPVRALLQPLAAQWRALDAAARRRAARCPYLLLDAGFGDPVRWRTASVPQQVADAALDTCTGYFSVPRAVEVARLIFIFAWHLARAQPAAARLLLGMPAPNVLLIGHYTLRQMQTLAETRAGWLRPRWPARVQVWQELLVSATQADPAPLERARLRGVTLLAAEARLAGQGAARCVAGRAPLPMTRPAAVSSRWSAAPAERLEDPLP